MKKIIPAVLIGIAFGVVATWLWLSRHHDEHAAAEKKEEHKEERVSHAENGDAIIKLDKETLEHGGFKSAALAPAEALPEMKVFGRVIDAGPLATAMSEFQIAEAASVASTQEFERQKSLQQQNNTSARAVQAAEAAAKRDKLQLGALHVKFMATWGRAVTELPNLNSQLGQLVSLESALVRLDLTAGESLVKPPSGARIFSLAKPEEAISAQYIGPLPAVDLQAQGQALLFLLPSNSQHLAPGAALTGSLKLAGEAKKGVMVPRDAVVRFNGLMWAYVKTGEATFTRREVASAQTLDGGFLVVNGFKVGEEIVTTGAQQLLSEELKGAAE